MKGERRLPNLKAAQNLFFAGLLTGCNFFIEADNTPTPELPTPTTFPFETETPIPVPTAVSSPTPFLTPTPSYEELQSLRPEGILGEIVMGENGHPQFLVDLPQGYGSEETKLTIAEWRGEWELIPFAFTATPENTSEILNSSQDSNDIYYRDNGVLEDSLIYNIIGGQIIGMGLDVDSEGRSELTWIIAYNRRVFKMTPDVFVIGEDNGVNREDNDTQSLTLEEVAKMVDFLGRQSLQGDTRFSIMLNSILEGATYEQAEFICQATGEKFNELCRGLSEDSGRLVDSLVEMNSLVDTYGLMPSESQVRSEDFWWNDEVFKPIPGGIINSAIVILLVG
jgi:hypothetical protein